MNFTYREFERKTTGKIDNIRERVCLKKVSYNLEKRIFCCFDKVTHDKYLLKLNIFKIYYFVITFC